MPDRRGLMILLITALTVVPSRAEEAPDIEMLEFLGRWETADGKFVDPMELVIDETDEETTTRVADET